MSLSFADLKLGPATSSNATTSYFTDGGPICRASVEQRVRMLHNMVKIIARVHNNADPFAVASLASKGRGEGWLEREINHWHDIAMEAHPGLSKFYDPVREWLVATAPPVPDPVFVHGDFNASNVLWDGEGISAILDLESIRIGPRESDIVYQYLIDRLASSFFTTGVDVPSLAERTAWYKEASGVELDHLGYHETRISFQLSCAAVAIARYEKRNLAVMPTPFMDFLNRRLMLMEFFKHQMPIIGS